MYHMRDKYIELIKEYIKVKPEYRYILGELKKDVLAVGATEEEFNEAVKEMLELPKGQQSLGNKKHEFNTGSINFSFFKPRYDKYIPKAIKIFNSLKHLVLKRKKWAILSLSIIVIAILSPYVANSIKSSKEKAQNVISNSIPVQIPIAKAGPIPLVYANLLPVDPEKIFSVKSTNIQLTVTGKPKKEILGFFPYWMLPEEDKIDLRPLTSISLFGLDVDGNGNIVTVGDNNQETGGWNMWQNSKLNDLIRRAKDQNLKVYLTFKSFNNSDIENLSTSDNAQKTFIANALYLVNSKNLDGINIDFEYTGVPSQNIRDGFTRLIENLNTELKRQIPQSVLTIDTYLVSGSEQDIFDIPLLSQNSDAFVIMGYDMHTPLGDPGPVSAMGGNTNIIGYVQNYLEQVDASKLILAVPYYGYDWPVSAQGGTENAASTSAGMVNILPYAEIVQQSQNVQLQWDDTSQTPYYTYTDSSGVQRIVHFDDVRSLGIKYDFINKKNLRGVGIWALGYDGQNKDLEKLLIDKFINQ